MTLQLKMETREETRGMRNWHQLTRLHPCQMHPCQLLFLVLRSNPTPKNQVLLKHEIAANQVLDGSVNGYPVQDWSHEIAGPDLTGTGDLLINAAMYARRRFAVKRYTAKNDGVISISPLMR